MSERLSIEDAKEQGFEVDVAADNELFLDIDDMWEGEDTLCSVAKMLDSHYGVVSIKVNRSKSGNKHIRIVLKFPLPVMIRIALQAACGSDPNRELLNINDILRGRMENPNILFEVPGSEYINWKHPDCSLECYRGPAVPPPPPPKLKATHLDIIDATNKWWCDWISFKANH